MKNTTVLWTQWQRQRQLQHRSLFHFICIRNHVCLVYLCIHSTLLRPRSMCIRLIFIHIYHIHTYIYWMPTSFFLYSSTSCTHRLHVYFGFQIHAASSSTTFFFGSVCAFVRWTELNEAIEKYFFVWFSMLVDAPSSCVCTSKIASLQTRSRHSYCDTQRCPVQRRDCTFFGSSHEMSNKIRQWSHTTTRMQMAVQFWIGYCRMNNTSLFSYCYSKIGANKKKTNYVSINHTEIRSMKKNNVPSHSPVESSTSGVRSMFIFMSVRLRVEHVYVSFHLTHVQSIIRSLHAHPKKNHSDRNGIRDWFSLLFFFSICITSLYANYGHRHSRHAYTDRIMRIKTIYTAIRFLD